MTVQSSESGVKAGSRLKVQRSRLKIGIAIGIGIESIRSPEIGMQGVRSTRGMRGYSLYAAETTFYNFINRETWTVFVPNSELHTPN